MENLLGSHNSFVAISFDQQINYPSSIQLLPQIDLLFKKINKDSLLEFQ